MRSFGRAAEHYESFAFVQRSMAAWLAQWVPEERAGTAIEAGAGTGLFTRCLLPWNGRLLATDSSPEMVARGRENLPDIEWLVTDAAALPDISAQWIFSSSFLQWASDPVSLFQHWREKLRPGGRILAGLFASPTLPELSAVLPGRSPLTWRAPEEWEEAIAAAGFDLVRSDWEARVFTFSSALDFVRTLHRVGAAPRARTPAGMLRAALRDYDRRFAAPGGVRSTWTFLRFEARNPLADVLGS